MSEKLYRKVEKQGCEVLEEVQPQKPCGREHLPDRKPVTFEHKTVTHKIQYRDIQKVMAGISLSRPSC